MDYDKLLNVYDNQTSDDRNFVEPKILLQDDNFLTQEELDKYQKLLHAPFWTPAPRLEKILFYSKDLYQHYKWDDNWNNARWLDDTPLEWEELYNKIALSLPAHYLHWADVKITPPLSTGTPRHRDKDPWTSGGSDRFSKSLTIIVNLNKQWDPQWGGEFIVWNAQKELDQPIQYEEWKRIPISPGQLLIMENCWHSIGAVTEPNRSRISFILHVLQYNNK